ncbi:hypothetical protein LTR56_024242 [Elasticomyces elasticus]|nr:hypothetical protein LTR56_024242 [Elasticomyces elasticus]KAK3625339.1 hypothetical protein LTR22_023594 [Elasticomyces elasticus]KAK4905994.1 hypothetical protein LTR49_024807 [Elasticomyces elasticus]KAK5756461.1 hypothetical protein LTS12_013415 [Elasticomyces elasticus]
MPGTKRSRAEHDEAPRKKGKQHTARPTIRTVSTRSMTRTSVFNAVFQTTELLENILYFLPLKGLAVAQMVCNKWRDVITQVEHFRQALFLEPAMPKAAWKWTMLRGNCHTLERLDMVPELSQARTFEDGLAIQASLHSLMANEKESRQYDMLQDACGTIVVFKDDAVWRTRHGSWRNMFVTQPPVLNMYAEYFSVEPNDCNCHDFDNHRGITVGDLIEYGYKLEADGIKVDWTRCWFVAHGRACWTDEEAEEAMRCSGSNNHKRY